MPRTTAPVRVPRGPRGPVVRVNGGRLRDLRVGAGLTQRTLATRCEISDRHVSKIECGGGASVPVLTKIADALRVPFGELLRAA